MHVYMCNLQFAHAPHAAHVHVYLHVHAHLRTCACVVLLAAGVLPDEVAFGRPRQWHDVWQAGRRSCLASCNGAPSGHGPQPHGWVAGRCCRRLDDAARRLLALKPGRSRWEHVSGVWTLARGSDIGTPFQVYGFAAIAKVHLHTGHGSSAQVTIRISRWPTYMSPTHTPKYNLSTVVCTYWQLPYTPTVGDLGLSRICCSGMTEIIMVHLFHELRGLELGPHSANTGQYSYTGK